MYVLKVIKNDVDVMVMISFFTTSYLLLVCVASKQLMMRNLIFLIYIFKEYAVFLSG